jgi:ACS family glucarate transporter-like MFS transporter
MTDIARPTRVRWMIVAAVFVTYVLMFIDRVNISIAAKYMIDEFGISSVEIGMIFSTFVFGYALFQIPGGWFGDRFGPRRVLGFAILWWSLFTAATAIAGDIFLASWIGVVGSFALVRFLIGVGEAVAPPNGARTIANWMAPGERGLAFGIIFAGNTIGAAIAPPLIVWIMVTFGWREAFYISGAVGIVVAALWYWVSSDRPAEHRWINRAEVALIEGDEREGMRADVAEVGAWWQLFRNVRLWCLTAAYFAVGYVLYLYFAWFYLYLVNGRGMSVEAAGVYTMAPFVVSAICAPLGGRLTDRMTRRYGPGNGKAALGIGGLVATAVFVVAGAAVEDVRLAVLLLALGAGGIYASMAAYWAAAIDMSESHAGTAAGLMNVGCNIGGVISPVLTPWIAGIWGWATALYVAGAVAIVGSLFWLPLIAWRRQGEKMPAISAG